MEARVSVVECQEAINRQLSAQIVVFTRQNLFTHTVTQLGNKVQNCSETKITPFTALVILRVFDSTATLENHHTRIDIFI